MIHVHTSIYIHVDIYTCTSSGLVTRSVVLLGWPWDMYSIVNVCTHVHVHVCTCIIYMCKYVYIHVHVCVLPAAAVHCSPYHSQVITGCTCAPPPPKSSHPSLSLSISPSPSQIPHPCYQYYQCYQCYRCYCCYQCFQFNIV